MPKPATPPISPLLLGGLALLAGEFSFALLAVVVRELAGELSQVQIVFFRNLAALIVMLPWMLRQGFAHFKPARFRYHFLRSAVGIGGMYCYFYAIGNLPLALAVLLGQTAPILIPLIAGVWLKERSTSAVYAAIGLGFSGVMVILAPWQHPLAPAALVGLLGAFFAATAKVTIRRMAGTEPSSLIVFYFTLISTLVSALPLGLDWQPASLSLWPWLLALGVTAAIGQFLMTKAFTLAPAGRIGALSYSQIVFAALLGWWLFQENLDWHLVAGGLLIAYAGLLSMGLIRLPGQAGRQDRLA
ncbi:MAG: DMT family transporter [Gammaproteobacteria bacterium]|nr:DMT family transporter [Gammaproteobacteria bacterium]